VVCVVVESVIGIGLVLARMLGSHGLVWKSPMKLMKLWKMWVDIVITFVMWLVSHLYCCIFTDVNKAFETQFQTSTRYNFNQLWRLLHVCDNRVKIYKSVKYISFPQAIQIKWSNVSSKLGKKHNKSETNCCINVFNRNVPHVNVILAGLLRKVLLFYGSVLCSQEPATGTDLKLIICMHVCSAVFI
jgi:hypothetical protein